MIQVIHADARHFMADDALEDLVRRLTDHLLELIEEQREFNRAQVRINTDVSATLARLDTLITEVFRDREGGREA